MEVAKDNIPKIIVDCDPGVDDCQALSLVLKAHKKGLVEVLAITIVNGNTSVYYGARNALRLLQTIDMLHIPVYAGATTPLNFPYIQLKYAFNGHDGFKNSNLPAPDYDKYIQKQSAINKIVEEAKLHKGNLTILAVGPLTNIAMAKMMEPDLFSYLHGLYIMGGNYSGEGNDTVCGEFNFATDPEAAQIVFSDKRLPRQKDEGPEKKDLAGCPVYVVPWETCLYETLLNFAVRKELGNIKTKEAELFNKADYNEPSEDDSDPYYVCDQTAAAWMVDMLLSGKLLSEEGRKNYSPLAQEVKNWYITVETQGVHCRGQMIVDRKKWVDYSFEVNVLTKVNNGLLRKYLEICFGHNA